MRAVTVRAPVHNDLAGTQTTCPEVASLAGVPIMRAVETQDMAIVSLCILWPDATDEKLIRQ